MAMNRMNGTRTMLNVALLLVLAHIPPCFPDPAVVRSSLSTVDTWTAAQVTRWASQALHPQGELVADAFRTAAVDGRTLLSFRTEEDLAELGLANRLLRKAILHEIEQMRATIEQTPHNLWEYRAAHRARTDGYLVALHWSPRFALLYAWMYESEDVLEPFVGADGTGPAFWTTLFLAPYTVVIYFANKVFMLHPFIAAFMIFNSVVLTIGEIKTMSHVFTLASFAQKSTREARAWAELLWQPVMLTLSHTFVTPVFITLLHWAVFPVVPWIVCDLLFYGTICLMPLLSLVIVQQWHKPVLTFLSQSPEDIENELLQETFREILEETVAAQAVEPAEPRPASVKED